MDALRNGTLWCMETTVPPGQIVGTYIHAAVLGATAHTNAKPTIEVLFGTELLLEIGRDLGDWTKLKELGGAVVTYPERPSGVDGGVEVRTLAGVWEHSFVVDLFRSGIATR